MTNSIIDPQLWGVSFSVKQCRNFRLDYIETLKWLIEEAGFRRFRLMSYWNECERDEGVYDFNDLDKQIKLINKYGGQISLCLGVRQPRWPEFHWPDWAWELEKPKRNKALLNFIQTVVNRYKDEQSIISWQLENEALLGKFGERIDIDRKRLKSEFALVKQIDQVRPVIMTTSTSWGIPLRRPIPDIIGFSYYQIVYHEGGYKESFHRPWLDRLRAGLIRVYGRPSFIHELQLEPWGPRNIWEMDTEEQSKSMSVMQIAKNLKLANMTKLHPVDLWGGEWWHWRLKQGDPSIWEMIESSIKRT